MRWPWVGYLKVPYDSQGLEKLAKFQGNPFRCAEGVFHNLCSILLC